MIEDIKKLLDLGFEIHSPNYSMRKTRWGNGVNKIEYALIYPSGKASYHYKDNSDDDYQDAIQMIIDDMEKNKIEHFEK